LPLRAPQAGRVIYRTRPGSTNCCSTAVALRSHQLPERHRGPAKSPNVPFARGWLRSANTPCASSPPDCRRRKQGN
jgi:hypothetical protein